MLIEALKFAGIFSILIGITAATTGIVSHRMDVPFREFPIGTTAFVPTARGAIYAGLTAIGVGIGLLVVHLLLR